jgi:hypothetical protein
MEKTEQERIVERLILCSEVIQRTHKDFVPPNNPEEKADLLLTVEGLAKTIMLFRRDVLETVWPGEVPVED